MTIDQQIEILNEDIKLLKVPSGNSIAEKYNSCKKKNSVKGLISRFESAEERSSEL